MALLVQKYLNLLNKQPLKITILTTGALCCAGDLIAQQVVEKRGLKQHDVRRTLKLTCMGLFFIAPTLRVWYVTLDKLVAGAGASAALKKMALDQALFAPAFIANFFVIADALDGKSVADIKEKLHSSYLPALKMNYFLWPAVQCFNFYLVPLQYRVVTANIVALFWNTYLSWAVSKQKDNFQQQQIDS